MAAAEDLKAVQLQVDSLKERLDFVTPMLSVLNFIQDYFQKVECEASVQMMRLKNGGVTSTPHAMNSPSADKISPQLVELAKWLHTMTDLAIRLHDSHNNSSSTTRDNMGGSPVLDNIKSAFPSLDGQSARSAPMPSVFPQDGTPPRHLAAGQRITPTQHTPSPSAPLRQPATPPLNEAVPMRGPDHSGRSVSSALSDKPSDVDHSRESAFLRRAVADVAKDPQQNDSRMAAQAAQPYTHSASPTSASSSASMYNLTAGTSRSSLGLHGVPRAYTAPSDTSSTGASYPAPIAEAERLRGGLITPDTSASDCGGLALGQGTWANVYRQATGPRREALKLLYTSGIVTERELADDLTVISESHVEECITIAHEMLKRWPSEHGPAPQREAKAFFEERLAALYMSRAPGQFG